MIVSNATPLLAFARIDALELLAHIVRHILIPETVWHEVTRDPWRPGAEVIRHASWVEVHPVATIPPEILPLLDRGEAEVIALAEAIRWRRKWCSIERAVILAVRPWLERMQSQGMHYSQRFIEELFRQLGE